MNKWLKKQQQDLDEILEENLERTPDLLPDEVLSIFHSPGRTSMLAQLFKVSMSTIARIKSQTGEYAYITRRAQFKKAQALLEERYNVKKVVQY